MEASERKRAAPGWLTRVNVVCFLLAPGLVSAEITQYAPCGHPSGLGWNCPETPNLPRGGNAPPPAPEKNPSSACGQDAGQGTDCNCTATTGNPIDLWNGREFFTHTDLVLPGLMDIVIRRSYDSQAEFDSALGYGWALSYFMRLYEYADGSVILRRDCGVRRAFVFEAGAYQTPVGESGTLLKDQDGSWTYWETSGEKKSLTPRGA